MSINWTIDRDYFIHPDIPGVDEKMYAKVFGCNISVEKHNWSIIGNAFYVDIRHRMSDCDTYTGFGVRDMYSDFTEIKVKAYLILDILARMEIAWDTYCTDEILDQLVDIKNKGHEVLNSQPLES